MSSSVLMEDDRWNALTTGSLFSVRGKAALVTGGSRGIGLMISRAFVRNGATVVISSRKASVCEAVAAELNTQARKSESGGRAIAIAADLSGDGDAGCIALAAAVRAAVPNGALHILVNNAGCTWGSTMEDYPEAAWSRCFDLNVKAVFEMTRACIPLLKRGSGGSHNPASVINIGSVAGVVAAPATVAFTPAYDASKAAVDQLTRNLAAQLFPSAITVNCLAPALFPSKMTSFMLQHDAAKEIAAASHPVGRVGTEADMAGAALFLASKASAFITGSTIYLDGGMVHVRHGASHY